MMNSGFYIIQGKSSNNYNSMNDNPLIINKIVTDLKSLEYT